MNIPNISRFSKGKMWNSTSIFASRRTEVSDTPDISGSSNREVWGTPSGSGSSKEMWSTCNVSGSRGTEFYHTQNVSGSRGTEFYHTQNVSGDRGTEFYHTQNVSGDRGTEVLERQCKDTDPRKMTAESSRHVSDTSQQPAACQDQASIMKEMLEIMKEMDNKKTKEMFEMIKEMDNKKTKEMFEMIKEMDIKKTKEMFEMIKEMDNKKTKEMFEMMKEMDNRNTKEMFEMMKEMDNKNTKEMFEMVKKMDNKKAFPGRAIQIQHQEEEETEMLKKQIKKLEARNQELLAKAMALHQDSEDINDPFRLSAVLQKYEMLRLREWEKVRSSLAYRWTYAEGSRVFRKLFDACEKDIQQKTDGILKVLDFPLWNEAVTKVMMQDIKKLFRQLYHQNVMLSKKIIQEAAIHVGPESEEQFLVQCCQIYCLLLLQEPPVKAEWTMNKSSLEHVDKKDAVSWKRASLLWPIMKRGEEIIVKGVVWEQKRVY